MSFAFLRLWALALVFVLVAGCSGSSGGGSSTSGGGGNPVAVTITFKGGVPTAVAAKIGGGVFTTQTLSSGTLSLSIPSGTTNFAVAFVCESASGAPVQLREQTVIELTIADGTAFTAPCGAVTPTAGQTGTLTGSADASAISGVSAVDIAVGNGNYSVMGGPFGTNGNFSFEAPSGNDRVEVVAYTSSVVQGYIGTLSLAAARTFTNQTIPGALNGGNSVVLAAGDETTSQPITYNNVPSGFSAPSTYVGFEMSGAGGFMVTNYATTQYPTLPAGAVESGDRYDLIATDYSGSGEGVSAEVTLTNNGPVTLTFPAPWSYMGPTPAALPTVDFAYAGFSGKVGVFESAGLEWFTGTIAENYSLIIATANYLNGSATVTFPDLSGLTGFPASPPSKTQVAWSAQIVQSNLGLMQAPSASNLTVNSVMNGGAFTVP